MKELPTFCTSTMVMFGTIATKSRGDSIPAALIVCSVKASMVTGTLCSDSSRFRAVTTISLSSFDCAGAGAATITPSSAVNAGINFPRKVLMFFHLPLSNVINWGVAHPKGAPAPILRRAA